MSPFGCTNTAPRSCDDCPTQERNKIVHVAFVKKGTTINKTTPALLMSSLLAAELACNAYIVRNVSGEYDGGTPTEGTGPGKQISRPLGSAHQATFTDFNYVSNVEFWNTFRFVAQNYEMYFFTDTLAWYVNKPVSASAKGTITNDYQTFIEALVTVKWSNVANPIPYKSDVDQLENCQTLFTFGTFVNESNSLASISGANLSIDSGDTINTYTNTAITLSSVEVKEGSLPSGITVSVSGTKIYIQGHSTALGTYPVTIRASNACGVSGEFEATILVE